MTPAPRPARAASPLRGPSCRAAAGARAVKRRLIRQLEEAMRQTGCGKSELARRMATSRSSLDRLLDPGNPSLTLGTLVRAARALGRGVRLELTGRGGEGAEGREPGESTT